MILPLYQPLGSSSHQLAQTIGERYKEKATHTGTLDPMAEGVLIVLTGEDRFQKSVYSKWPKVYNFSIIWGLQTDSDDSLGLITKHSTTEIAPETLNNIPLALTQFTGDQQQALHAFSARRWQGKSSFDFAKQGIAIPTTYRTIHIEKLFPTGLESISSETILEKNLARLQLMQGEWRQEAIQKNWQEIFPQLPPTLMKTSFQLYCSHGTYVRQLARDITKHIGFPGFVWDLQRIRNGKYTTKDCKDIKKFL